MEFSFFPKRLKAVQREVSVLHKNIDESVKISADDELEHLIRSLTELDNDNDLAWKANMLTNQEVYRIAAYLPYNYFHVNMRNLFCIFIVRSGKRLFQILYNQWQNSYDNESCNEFIHSLLKNNEDFREYVKEKHLNVDRLADIFYDQNIVIGFGSEVTGYYFKEKRTLAEKFEYFGIHSDSKLYKDCLDVFYTFCGKEDYLEADKNEILNIVKKYELRQQPLLKIFLKNFLGKLNLQELADFQDLARYFEAVIGDSKNLKADYKYFFKDLPEDVVAKYMDWINRCKIEKYFGDDERSNFWKQYRFEQVKKFEKSNAVVMKFGEYIAVEFLGERNGPIYFYPRMYFEKKLEGQFLLLENIPMRKYLLHESQYKEEDRKEHRGYWEYNVENYIIKHHITRKVYQ